MHYFFRSELYFMATSVYWNINNKKHLKNVGPIRYCEPFYIVIHQASLLPPLSHAACALMSTTTTTTTRDRGDCYGPMEWSQIMMHCAVRVYFTYLLLCWYNFSPDHWLCYKEYFSSAFQLIDSSWSPDTAADLWWVICSLLSSLHYACHRGARNGCSGRERHPFQRSPA